MSAFGALQCAWEAALVQQVDASHKAHAAGHLS